MVVTHYPSLVVQDTWETDGTGSFMLPEKLKVGTYYLKEVEAPAGYLQGKLLEFKVDGQYEWESPLVVEYMDIPAMGKISITKQDEVTGNKLQGAVFNIYAAEDIVTPDGTVRVEKNSVVDTITTGSDGLAVSKKLYLGNYKVQEIKPAPGFALSKEIHKAELKYKDQTTELVQKSLQISNQPTTIIIDKKVAGTEQRLSGVKFAVWNKAMTEGIDSGIAQKETVLTAKNGQAKIERLLPGTYCIQEVEGVAGYALDNKIHEITIDENGQIDGKAEVEIVVENKKTKIGTTAKDQDTGKQQAIAKKDATIVDTVSYENVNPGKEYVIKGILMDKSTGKELLIGGNPVTAEKTFIPEKSSGTVDITFTFDASALQGTSVVVFERLYEDGIEAAVHADIKDEGQTVEYPKHEIGTTAMDKDTESHQGIAKKQTTIVDKVKYSGLIVGQEYTVKGVLMDKATGKEFLVEGKPVTAEKTFKAKKPEGSIELEFTFDSSALKGNAVVVFEHLYCQETEVAVHTDINDKNQTVEYPKHEIRTMAKDKESGTQELTAKAEVTIVDTVSYEGLVPGQEYTLKGILMDKETEKPLLVKGKEITAEVKFTPEQASGDIEVEFRFNALPIKHQKEIVVFERLYVQDTEVATHTDIKDRGQTVKVKNIGHITTSMKDKPKHGSNVKTGDSSPVAPWLFLSVCSVGVAGLAVKKRKGRGSDEK